MNKLSDFLGASAVLTLLGAVLYISGYFILFTKYDYFGVPLSLIDLDFNNILVAGRGPLILSLIILATMLFINRGLINVKKSLTDKGYKKCAYLVPGMNAPNDTLSWIGILLFVVAGYFVALKICIEYQGNYTAKSIDEGKYPIIEFYNPPNLLPDVELRLLTHSQSRYIVFEVEEHTKKSPSVYIIDDKGIGDVHLFGKKRH